MSDPNSQSVQKHDTSGNISDWHCFTIKELLLLSKTKGWHEVNQDLAKVISSLSKYNAPTSKSEKSAKVLDSNIIVMDEEKSERKQNNENDVASTLRSIRNELECNICLNFYVEPITISCGHTFCRLCIFQFQSKCAKKCPLCKRVCHIDASHHQQNIVLNNCIKTLISKEQYTKRLKALQLEKDKLSNNIPIFILNMVRYPGMLLHLHLFEPRYKHMMNRAISSGNMFAYLCKPMNTSNGNDNRPYEGDTALLVDIKDCQFFPDGRCLMAGLCTTRILVEQTWVEDGTQGLWYIKYKDIKDDNIANDNQNEMDDVLEQIKVIDAFVNDCHSGSPAVARAIAQECGSKVELNANHDNMEAWSFYVTSLIYTALRKSASLSNSWITICLKTRNTMERVQACYDVLRSVQNKTNR
eukprot:118396_1